MGLNWAGRVERMEDKRLTNGVEGKKTKGRPRRRWEDYVKRGVTEVGGGVENEGERYRGGETAVEQEE